VEDLVFGRRYRVTEKIGTGGMADVYKAVDETLGRTVAVKVMHARYASDPAFASRFRQEAQAAANLQSPNIVNMYDWGADGDTYYIVMEYVRGSDLKSIILEKGALPSKKVADIGAQVASALSVAHGYDIIHRDIKPHNIMVQPDGSVKVMDFGIARAGNSTMTQTGSVLGTAHYVSPEQAQGKELTGASDLYSLGVVLYECVTGTLPFDADTPVAVALKQVNEQPLPPSARNNQIDPGLEAIIVKAMQKRAPDRYSSPDEMRQDLRRVVSGEPVHAASAAAGAMVAGGAAAAAARRMDATSVLPSVGSSGSNGYGQQAARSPVPKKRPIWPWLLAVGLLVLAGLGVAAGMGAFGPKSAVIPDVTGKPREEAQALLTEAGFVVGAVTDDFSDTVPLGAVVSQQPAANSSAKKGISVSLALSRGPNMIQVPTVTSMTESEAFKTLESAGFSPQALPSEFNKEVASGTVFKQTPAGGDQAPKGSVVSYVVSRGTELIQVPDVTGKSQSSATSTLQKAGFKVSVRESTSDKVDKGSVMSQNPPSGVSVAKGSTVSITVASGPATAEVPAVIGKTEAEAKAALSAVGFKVTVTTEPGSDTLKVTKQEPIAGKRIDVGSTVIITIDGPTPTP
jgi:beta-lactam-binding protein with PASTA domain/tRNA A-37 threonylcarbamoyl transferase component Bud32